MIITDTQERGRFLRFAMVGVIGALVDFGTFNLLVNLTTMSAVWVSMVSFTAAVLSNFMWDRFWTYPDSRSKAVSQQMVQFLMVSFVGLAVRTPLFAWMEKVMIQSCNRVLPAGFPLNNTFLGHNIALAVAVLVVMLWNFFANRLWTYNDVG